MSLSADLIVSAIKNNRSSVVLNRRQCTEREYVFSEYRDNIHCLGILANQLTLLSYGMADTRSIYKKGSCHEVFNYLLDIQVN